MLNKDGYNAPITHSPMCKRIIAQGNRTAIGDWFSDPNQVFRPAPDNGKNICDALEEMTRRDYNHDAAMDLRPVRIPTNPDPTSWREVLEL